MQQAFRERCSQEPGHSKLLASSSDVFWPLSLILCSFLFVSVCFVLFYPLLPPLRSSLKSLSVSVIWKT